MKNKFILLIIGIFITPHYGEPQDELKFYRYANLAPHAYTTFPTQGTVEFKEEKLIIRKLQAEEYQ